jgi:hypothetical protein
MADFDPNWPHGHITRDGRKARIICTDAESNFPIVALVDGIAQHFTPAGQYRVGSLNHLDLLNAPAPKRKVRMDQWMNVYADGAYLYATKAAADDNAWNDRIACIHIDREVEEGEGL